MIELKLNEELPLIEPSNVKIKNIKGNIRYVGYGRTNSISLASSTWKDENFTNTCTAVDSNFVSVSTYNALRIVKPGLYLIVWHQRAVDSSTSQCSQVRFSSDVIDDTAFSAWGGGVYRNHLHGNWIKYLNTGDLIYVRMYSDGKAVTASPMTVWVFAIEGSENI